MEEADLNNGPAREPALAAEDEPAVLAGVRAILEDGAGGYRNLITVLQQVQDHFGYVPKTGMTEIARHFGVSPANVYGVATFYNQFRFTPPGKCHVRVCLGTACHIKQGDLIMDQWKRRLEIEEGGRTKDGEFSLERVACVGACAMAPVSIVCDQVIGHMAPTKVDGIILEHRIEKERQARAAAREKEPLPPEGEPKG